MSNNESDKKPLFVVIEGIDRCGKNLQADLLERRLAASGRSVRQYSTPHYKGFLGESISHYLSGRILLTNEARRVLQSMLICNRYVVAAHIKRSLAGGSSVVCVRWWQSSVFYGELDGVDPLVTLDACSHLPEPDIHLLLDVDPDEVSKRLYISTRYEDPAIQRGLAKAYQGMWENHRGKDPGWIVVQGDATPTEVADRIWREICTLRPDLA